MRSFKHLVVAAVFGSGMVVAAQLPAQKDSVHLKADSSGRKSLIRGRITETSPFRVTVNVDGTPEQVAVSQIKKVTFSEEPRGLTRAREHLENQRFDDCLDSIRKLEDVPDSRLIQQELKFLEVYSTAKKALRADKGVTLDVAENSIAAFIKANNDSYRLVHAVDLYGQLLMANGKTEQAQKEFSRLTKSKWDEYVTKGYFFEGETLVHQEKYDLARKSFELLMQQPGSDDVSRQYKLLAECQLAKISALQGNVGPAIATVENIIQNQNTDNTQLFAYAYNALGTGYLQSNELKKACRAFLHTELLFSTEPDAHAEALYHLSKIWPELKETDRANRARELLTSRYRNTIWAKKL